MKQLLQVLILMFGLFFSIFSFAQYSGGYGTKSNPYKIKYVKDLIELSDAVQVNDQKGVYFQMENDIDFTVGGIDSSIYYRPIAGVELIAGGFSSTFEGIFNGNGFLISNYKLEDNTKETICLGVFGILGNNAILSNLGVENINIKTAGHAVGGLVGFSLGEIINCYSKANIESEAITGGFVGVNFGSITNCYSISKLKAPETAGGFVGSNHGIIENCYSVPLVIISSGNMVGAFLGYNQMTMKNCYYLEVAGKNAVGYGTSTGLTLKTSSDLKNSTSLLNDIQNPLPWKDDIDIVNDGYPILEWQRTVCFLSLFKGSGTKLSPYEIRYAKDMISLASLTKSGCSTSGVYFKLMNDIDFTVGGIDSSIYYYPIGGDNTRKFFDGIFDGNGHVISNLSIVRAQGQGFPNEIGLFGSVGSNSIISNLGVENIIITTRGSGVGGLVGYSEGEINNCYSKAFLDNTSIVNSGGLIGSNSGEINNCYSISEFNTYSSGGLVGTNIGVIKNSYSYSHSFSATNKGMFIENNLSGTMENCYCLDGGIAGVGKGSSIGLTLKTSSDLKNSTSLLNDIQNPLPWKDDINIVNDGYPILEWQRADCFSSLFEGSGTKLSPYEIRYAKDMISLASLTENGCQTSGLYFKMMNDISFKIGSIDSSIYFTPIYFEGHFDGGGYVVSNLTIKSDKEYVALFSFLKLGSIINLGIEDSEIIAKNTTLTGTNTGSLVGFNWGGNIENCYSSSTVKVVNEIGNRINPYVGGLVGNTMSGMINNCYSKANVVCNVKNSHVGGLVGTNLGTVFSKCYSLSIIESNGEGSYTGGFLGFNNNSAGHIYNCYARATIEAKGAGNIVVGGFVGENAVRYVRNCYAASTIDVGSSTSLTMGSFMGRNSVDLKDCYFQKSGSLTAVGTEQNQNVIYGIREKTETEFKELKMIDLLNANQSTIEWKKDFLPPINDGYPILDWQLFDMKTPFVITDEATDVDIYSVTLNGQIIKGIDPIIRNGFAYKATNESNWLEVDVTLGTVITKGVNGLLPDTDYEYKAFAETANAIVYGGVKYFTTKKEINLVVITLEDVACTAITGLIKGEILEGEESVIEKGFEYKGMDDGIWKFVVVDGDFEALLKELSEGVEYEFRAYAKNKYKTVKGDIFKFRLTSGISGVFEKEYKLLIYPNPATTKVNFKVEGLKEKTVVIITDIQGKVIDRFEINNSEKIIDVSRYPKGVYFVRINNQIQKLIVQ